MAKPRPDNREIGFFPDRARIYLHCNRCGNERIVPIRRMIERVGTHTTIGRIRERALCERCRLRGKDITVQVWLD